MTFDYFVSVDPAAVREAETAIFLTSDEHNFGLGPLFEIESEDEDFGIAGLDHLRKAIIASRVYRALSGMNWNKVKNIIYADDKCGAIVEFPSKEAAMLFKLSQGGTA